MCVRKWGVVTRMDYQRVDRGCLCRSMPGSGNEEAHEADCKESGVTVVQGTGTRHIRPEARRLTRGAADYHAT